MVLADDWICIEGVAFKCIIGVHERERVRKQDIIVNLHVKLDFGKAAVSDSLRDTVDYRALTQRVVAIGQGSQWRLIESLASQLSNTLLDEFPQIQQVRVEVWKPGALRVAKSVGAVTVSTRDS